MTGSGCSPLERPLRRAAMALILRVAVIVVFPSIHNPDEIFQVLEQAHRLAFGYGIVPYEFRDGTRSPVLPMILGYVFSFSEPIAGGPEGYIFVSRFLTIVISLAGVAAVYRM